jgi:lipopolysaccharide transport system ATP-binding protein
MSDVVVKVEGLGKRYQIARRRERHDTLRDALTAGARRFGRRLGRCFRKPIEADDYESFWALQDVSFEVKRGEVLGLIGRNGAGKSTLLKLLSRITEPTTGRLSLRGRVASLLEVGTGFHPELTGRENIYLNGAILGMKRAEITRKFDEIVAFAEVEQFLDTPVKRYSSGMYVRLAFAVAAHLEPEILLVDEVLAVGDVGFQRKCMGKMGAVAKENRTVLFVSHNMSIVRALCTRGIILNRGQIALDSSAQNAANAYMNSNTGTLGLAEDGLRNRLERTSGQARFTSIRFEDEDGRERFSFPAGTTVQIVLTCHAYKTVPSLGLLIQLYSGISNEQVTSIKAAVSESEVRSGSELSIRLTLPQIPLRPGDYSPYICLGSEMGEKWYDVIDKNVSLPCLSITSQETDVHKISGYCSIPWQLAIERK